MRKILIVSFYELKDYLTYIATLFETRYKWEVISYPLFMYCYDKNSKIDNYIDHFTKYISESKPDIILWWFMDVQLTVFNKIYKCFPNIYYVLYNYSDPLNVNKVFFEKCKIFDQIISVCNNSLPLYKVHVDTKYIDFCPFGYDNNVFGYDMIMETVDDKYRADISFICDSLFMDQNDQIVKREKIIKILQEVSNEMNLSFKLYGPEMLSMIAKNNYCGEARYFDMPSIFNKSKINIISHPNGKKKLPFTNVNLFPCMASNGLVLMDNVQGSNLFFNHDKQCVFLFEEHDLKKKIKEIITLYANDDNKINEIKINARKFSSSYEWTRFTDLIFEKYNHHAFDVDFYRKTYKINEIPDEKLYSVWINKWKKYNIIHVPYKVTIMPNFNVDKYKELKCGKKNKNVDEYYFIEWWMNGRDSDFIKKTIDSQVNVSGKEYNITTPKIFDVYNGFNKIFYVRDIDGGLQVLNDISNDNPRLKINNLLKKYIDMSYNE